MKYTALLFCLAVTAVAVNAASVSGQASIDRASAAIGGRIQFPRIPGINAPIGNILGGLFGGPHRGHRRPGPPPFFPPIPGPNGNRQWPVLPPNGNRTSPVDIPNGNRTTSNETPNDSSDDSANESTDDAANDAANDSTNDNNSPNDPTNDSPNSSSNDSPNGSPNDSTNDSQNDATNDASNDESPSDDASNDDATNDDASNDDASNDDASNVDSTNDDATNDDSNGQPSPLNRLANLFDIPDPNTLIPDIPSGGNTRDVDVPAIPGLPDLSQLPRIPGLSTAIEMARDHVQEALGLGTDIAGGIQEAMQEAFDSEDPAAAIRTIVRTIIDAYLTVAANCPVMVVGSRVIQEGIRLALEVAASARNVIFGTTSAPPVL